MQRDKAVLHNKICRITSHVTLKAYQEMKQDY